MCDSRETVEDKWRVYRGGLVPEGSGFTRMRVDERTEGRGYAWLRYAVTLRIGERVVRMPWAAGAIGDGD
jgi:hypothetical protein